MEIEGKSKKGGKTEINFSVKPTDKNMSVKKSGGIVPPQKNKPVTYASVVKKSQFKALSSNTLDQSSSNIVNKFQIARSNSFGVLFSCDQKTKFNAVDLLESMLKVSPTVKNFSFSFDSNGIIALFSDKKSAECFCNLGKLSLKSGTLLKITPLYKRNNGIKILFCGLEGDWTNQTFGSFCQSLMVLPENKLIFSKMRTVSFGKVTVGCDQGIACFSKVPKKLFSLKSNLILLGNNKRPIRFYFFSNKVCSNCGLKGHSDDLCSLSKIEGAQCKAKYCVSKSVKSTKENSHIDSKVSNSSNQKKKYIVKSKSQSNLANLSASQSLTIVNTPFKRKRSPEKSSPKVSPNETPRKRSRSRPEIASSPVFKKDKELNSPSKSDVEFSKSKLGVKTPPSTINSGPNSPESVYTESCSESEFIPSDCEND